MEGFYFVPPPPPSPPPPPEVGTQGGQEYNHNGESSINDPDLEMNSTDKNEKEKSEDPDDSSCPDPELDMNHSEPEGTDNEKGPIEDPDENFCPDPDLDMNHSEPEGTDAQKDDIMPHEGTDAQKDNSMSHKGTDAQVDDNMHEGTDAQMDHNMEHEGTELFDDFICPDNLPDDYHFTEVSDFIVELKDAIIILTEKEALMCMSDKEIDLSKFSKEREDPQNENPSVSILEGYCFLDGKLGLKDELKVEDLLGDSKMYRDGGSIAQLDIGCKLSLVSAKILDTRFFDINAGAAKGELKFVTKIGTSGINAQVEAGAYLAEVSGKIGPDELNLNAEGKVGIGATGTFIFENGKVKAKIGVAFLLGGEMAINVDFKKILEFVHQEPDKKTEDLMKKYKGEPQYFDDFPIEWRDYNKILVPINEGFYGARTIDGKSVIYE